MQGFIFGVLIMALQCLTSADTDEIIKRNMETINAPEPEIKKVYWAKEANDPMGINDEFLVNDIEDEVRVMKAINWSNKLRSEVIDFVRHKNLELEKKVFELVDPHRDRRDDVSCAKEKKEKENKNEKEKEEKDTTTTTTTTTLEPSEDRKVLNNETRPKDQDQMIRIELPAGVHSGKNTKLLHPNDTSFVNPTEENIGSNKPSKNKKKFSNSSKIQQDEEKPPTIHNPESRTSSFHPRRRRDADVARFNAEHIELNTITLQFKHLTASQKTKFCRFLKTDSIEEPLQMVMALLGKVYSNLEEESGAHWDRVRGIKLNEIRDKKARQKLILNWACEDRRRVRDRIPRTGIRFMGFYRN